MIIWFAFVALVDAQDFLSGGKILDNLLDRVHDVCIIQPAHLDNTTLVKTHSGTTCKKPYLHLTQSHVSAHHSPFPVTSSAISVPHPVIPGRNVMPLSDLFVNSVRASAMDDAHWYSLAQQQEETDRLEGEPDVQWRDEWRERMVDDPTPQREPQPGHNSWDPEDSFNPLAYWGSPVKLEKHPVLQHRRRLQPNVVEDAHRRRFPMSREEWTRIQQTQMEGMQDYIQEVQTYEQAAASQAHAAGKTRQKAKTKKTKTSAEERERQAMVVQSQARATRADMEKAFTQLQTSAAAFEARGKAAEDALRERLKAEAEAATKAEEEELALEVLEVQKEIEEIKQGYAEFKQEFEATKSEKARNKYLSEFKEAKALKQGEQAYFDYVADEESIAQKKYQRTVRKATTEAVEELYEAEEKIVKDEQLLKAKRDFWQAMAQQGTSGAAQALAEEFKEKMVKGKGKRKLKRKVKRKKLQDLRDIDD